MMGMSTVAEQLRAGREARRLTVEQVAELTKIRTDHIRALEDGNFNVFSAPIYIRGSVKNYSNMLKLDTSSLLIMLDAELGRTEKYSEPPPLVDSKKTLIDDLTLLLAKVNWKIGIIILAVVAAIGIIGVSVWAWHHHEKNAPLKKLPPAVVKPSNAGDTLPLPKR